jgi:hypothetical protein
VAVAVVAVDSKSTEAVIKCNCGGRLSRSGRCSGGSIGVVAVVVGVVTTAVAILR